MEDGRLDAAIDRAVREMLDVEPPAGLPGRVVARIERPRRAVPRWTWAPVPVAASAIVVLAIMLPSRQPAAVPVHEVVAAKAPRPWARLGPVASAVGATTSVPTVPDGALRTASANRTRVVVATSLATADASVTGVERLASIDPIGIRAIGPAGISQPDISISPLASIPQIRVELLSPPDGRN